ncbi:MAG: hypothetical protein Q7R80_03080, partial [bacterium]|nr:hypothetical protein [bacterium]
MSTETAEYPFFVELGRAIKSGSARAMLMTGNIDDLVHWRGRDGGNGGAYVPLTDFLTRRFDTHPEGGVPYVPVVYDLTGPIRFGNEADRSRFAKAWVKFQT